MVFWQLEKKCTGGWKYNSKHQHEHTFEMKMKIDGTVVYYYLIENAIL